MAEPHLFTSESVSEGHPDKMADQISDAILDALLAQDKHSRVACETLVKTGMVMVAGEITTDAHVDIESLVRGAIDDIGYNHSESGFDCNTCAVVNAIGRQSPDIAMGVDGVYGSRMTGGGFGGRGFSATDFFDMSASGLSSPEISAQYIDFRR